MRITATPTTITVSSDALERASKWTAQRAALLDLAPTITTVANQAEAERAVSLANAIRDHIKALDTERRKVTAPLDKMKSDIMAQEKSMRSDLEAERTRIKSLSDAYATRLAIERTAEAKRQIEAAEAARMEAAERAAEAERLWGPEADEPAPELATLAAPPPVAKIAGARMVKRWTHWIQDASAVPREYLTVDDAKIRAYVSYTTKLGNDPVVPGVVFEARMSVE